MADIIGGVKITGFISPTDSEDTYAVIDPKYGIDGLRNLESLSDMYSISDERMRQGMIVGVKSGDSVNYYTLLKSSGWLHDSGDWVELKMVTGLTFNVGTYDLTLDTINGGITESLSILATDMTVTGGSYNITTGIVTFTNNSGGTFPVSGFTTGFTDTYISAATYNQPTGSLALSFTMPAKDFSVTGITSIYGSDDSLKSNRVVNLSGKTLNFSSSTQPNSLTINTSGQVGVGVSSASNVLHVSATTNPIKVEGLSSVSNNSKIIGIDSSNQLQIFTGNTNSVAYFLNGNMVTSDWLTFTSGTTHTLSLATSNTSYGAELNFGASRASLKFPASASGDLTIKVGATTPFDASKSIAFRNGGTKLYLYFDSEGGNPPAGVANLSGHTATFGSTLIVNTSIDGLGYGTSFWGTSGIVTRTVANTYIDTTTAATANELVGSSFGIPTFSSFSAKTYSALTNVYIDGAPIAGTNASILSSYALKVQTGTTYFGDNVTLSGISTGTTSQLLTRESTGNVSFRNIGDIGVISSGNTTLYWYDENDTPPTIRPVATGTNSIAFGSSAKALGQNMFVVGTSAGTSTSTIGLTTSGASGSTFIGYQTGVNAFSASNSTFIGNSAGYAATNATDSVFIGVQAGYGATNANDSFFFGSGAGYQTTSASNSIFIGQGSGSNANGSSSSCFIGYNSGLGGTNASDSFFVGTFAGYQSKSASNSIFIGSSAGRSATGTTYSLFAGNGAGWSASTVTSSTFIGRNAGSGATTASYSIFIGEDSGKAAAAVKNIILGYRAGSSGSFGNNNIIIGTNVTLGSGIANSFNIGGVLFGTGMNSIDVGTSIYTATTTGAISVGINAPHASSILDLTSTAKGFLPPRMTAAQASAIVSPAEGLMVYVTNTNGTFTTKGWWGFDGTTWKQLG